MMRLLHFLHDGDVFPLAWANHHVDRSLIRSEIRKSSIILVPVKVPIAAFL